MGVYSGIDLHSNNSYVMIAEDERHVLFEKRMPNDREEILQALAPFKDRIEGVVVESTFNWYWLVDGLMDEGYEVHLANTAGAKQYEGLKYTDDKSDARWLIQTLRPGILPEGFIYPKEYRPVRDLLRQAREEAGLTQVGLARRLGITQQAVGRAERWSSNPTWALIRTWAEACGRTLHIELK